MLSFPSSCPPVIYLTLIRQGIVPQTLHRHLVHPISTCTIALERIANLPRLPRQEDESIRVKIQERACWIVQPRPDRDTGGGFDREILRCIRVRERDAWID